MPGTTLFTIGFTKKSAERFFTLLREAGVRRVLDTRLNNSSQLAGFAKREDLAFFLKELGGIDYVPAPELAPTQELVDLARKQKEWERFERGYRQLIRKRKVAAGFTAKELHMGCLLCSEDRPDHCHRRIAAEHLAEAVGDVRVVHLV
jgi:uncharacterized protein (DUF488 family)